MVWLSSTATTIQFPQCFIWNKGRFRKKNSIETEKNGIYCEISKKITSVYCISKKISLKSVLWKKWFSWKLFAAEIYCFIGHDMWPDLKSKQRGNN